MSSDLYSKEYNIRFFHCPKCAFKTKSKEINYLYKEDLVLNNIK